MTAPDPQTLSRHRRLMSRLLKIHFLAYVPAFAAAVAVIPLVVEEALADGGARHDELEVMLLILARSAVVFGAAFLVSHALGIPWLRATNDAGRRLALGGPLAMTALAVIAGGVGWIGLLWK